MNDSSTASDPVGEASTAPWRPVRDSVPEDRRISILVHSDTPATTGSILRALEAIRATGFGRDVHFVFHGSLAPVESLMTETGARVFSSGPKLDPAALRKLARTFGYFPWCCVLPLRNANRDTLEILAARGAADWRAPEGAFAFNRLLEWQEPPVRIESIPVSEEEPLRVPESPPENRPAITVIIPTYNRIDILEKTLRGYAVQSLRKDLYEVLVVDDGSTDSTWATLERLKAEVPYELRCFSQANKGPGQARNFAMAESRGEYLLITGDDIIPGPDLLWSHLRTHKAEPDPRTAVLGKVDWAPDLTVNLLMHLVTDLSSIQFGFHELERGKAPDFRYFYTSNISLKKSFLTGKPWFRPEFVHAAYEDIELGYRLQNAGMRIVYDREGVGYHHHPMTIASFAKRQYKSGLMALVYGRMHPEMAEEIGLNANDPASLDAENLRKDIDRLQGLIKKTHFGQYENMAHHLVPSKEAAELVQCMRYIIGASYTLGILDAVAEDVLKNGPVAIQAPTCADGAAALNAEGEALFGSGDGNGAILKFCAALDAEPSLGSAWNNLGVAAWSQGRMDEARRLFRFALDVDPGNASAAGNMEAIASEPALRKA